MSGTAAILALRDRIATNTLTASDQGALTTALNFVAPTFGTPDETSALVFSDEENAREMMAALYTIAAGGGAALIVPAKVTTPTTPETQVTLTPGAAGQLLAVIDITPTSTGLVLVSANFGVIPASADAPQIAMFFVEDLTAVTGGTLVSPGLTTHPTSITPALPGSGEVFATADTAETIAAQLVASLTFAGVPVQLTVGHRAGIAFFAVSNGTIAWTVGMSISAVEQPPL
jgi:hypothetical protein